MSYFKHLGAIYEWFIFVKKILRIWSNEVVIWSACNFMHLGAIHESFIFVKFFSYLVERGADLEHVQL